MFLTLNKVSINEQQDSDIRTNRSVYTVYRQGN